MDTSGYLTLQETATRLGVSERTVRRWIKTGRLPATRLGERLLRVDATDVDALMQPTVEDERES